jgi:SAM-dependent methyltransferase
MREKPAGAGISAVDRAFSEKPLTRQEIDNELPPKPVILVAADGSSNVDKLRKAFEPDYCVVTATNGREAVQLVKKTPHFDAILVGQTLPLIDGLTLVRYVNEMVPMSESIVKMVIADNGGSSGPEINPFIGRIDHVFHNPYDVASIKQKTSYLLAHRSREKRGIMRATFAGDSDIEVEIGLRGKAIVENLSEDGMFVRTILPKDYILPFRIMLPTGEELLATGRIVRTDKDLGGVGVKFLLMEDESRRTLVRFIADSMTPKGLADLKEKYEFLRTESIVPFTDPRKIKALLTAALRTKTEITAIHSHQKNSVTLEIAAVGPDNYCRLAGEHLDSKFKTSDSIFVSFQAGYATYNFETVVYRINRDGRALDCIYPRMMFYSEKRSVRRVSSDGELEAEITLPPPFDTVIRGAITDISEGGVSFLTDARDVALLIGTPLESIRIFQGDKMIREVRGEIRNIHRTSDRESDRLRYGVQFGIGRMSVQTAEMPPLEAPAEKPKTKDTEKFRMGPRRQSDLSDLAKRPPDVIRLENGKGEEIVGLLNTSLPLDADPLPVVIIPPAFGKTKETLFALAQTIVENFYLRGKSIAVIRFDGVRRKGESHKDQDASEPPLEMIHASFTDGADDIKAVVDWLDLNPRLKPSSVILLSFSLSALDARIVLRDDTYRPKIKYWISCMGTPEFGHLMTRVNCGLDFLEQHQLGIQLGVMPVLGNLVHVDAYVADGVANGVATLEQARRDMARLDLPITWIYGEHDHWVKPEFIRDIMSVQSNAPREVISVPIGHNARTSEEALQLFGHVATLIYRFLYRDSLRPVAPHKKDMEIMRRGEKDRIPPRSLKNRRDYWNRYLIGEERLIGFDVMALSDDYRGLMDDQIGALDLHSTDRLLDLGGGTGNFLEQLLERGAGFPKRVTVADLIPAAMSQARRKVTRRFSLPLDDPRFDFVALDAEMNRSLPVRRYLDGEIGRFRALSDKIENLPLRSAELIDEAYSPRLHCVLRGEPIGTDTERWLKSRFDVPEFRIIVDFNRAARMVRDHARPAQAKFRRLSFPGDATSPFHLPFRSASFDKILMSLVLSYIFNPVETLREVRRVIAPGGRLILSTMRPDADASGLFTRLVEKIERTPAEDLPVQKPKAILLESIRSFLNDAQALVELEEAGTFDFFAPDALNDVLEEAGWEAVQNIPSFGNPPQGYVVIAKEKSAHG